MGIIWMLAGSWYLTTNKILADPNNCSSKVIILERKNDRTLEEPARHWLDQMVEIIHIGRSCCWFHLCGVSYVATTLAMRKYRQVLGWGVTPWNERTQRGHKSQQNNEGLLQIKSYQQRPGTWRPFGPQRVLWPCHNWTRTCGLDL